MSEASTAAQTHLTRLARGGALGLVGSAVAVAAGFSVSVLVARGFDARVVGVFFAPTSLFALSAAGCLLGVDSGLARFLLRLEAERRERDVRRTVRLALVSATAAASVVALVGFASADALARWLGLGGDGALPMRILSVALPGAVAAEVLLSSARAFGRIGTTVMIDRVLRSGLQVVVVGTIVLAGGRLALVVAGWAAAYAVSAAFAALALSRLLAARRHGDGDGGRAPHLARGFWAFTAPRGVAGLAQVAIQKADIVIVAALLSPVDAAVYAVATRFVAVGQMANQAIHQALQPSLTAILILHDRATLRHVHGVATTWGILLVWPVYLVVGCAPVVYLSLFGSGYGSGTSLVGGGTTVVVVMAVAMMVAVATGPVDTLLLMAGRSGLSMTNSLLALGVDIGLCLLLVPEMGIPGAALAWAGAVTSRSALAFLQVHRHLGVNPGPVVLLRIALRPLVCFALPVSAFTAMGFRQLTGWLLVCLVSGCVYLAVLHASRRELELDLLVAALRGAATTPASTPASTPATTHTPHPSKESDGTWMPASSPAP